MNAQKCIFLIFKAEVDFLEVEILSLQNKDSSYHRILWLLIFAV